MKSPTSLVNKEILTPINALASYWYYREGYLERIVDQCAGTFHMIGDSGAFSAHTTGAKIDIEDYALWLDRHAHALSWMASLDVIGDAERSWANFRWLTNQGMTVVPTVHFGAPTKVLDRYGEHGCRFVGLGGLAGLKDTKAALRWLVKIFIHARDRFPDMRFHGWGVTRRRLLDALPFWSVDSSSYLAGMRYAQVKLLDGITLRHINVDLDGSNPGKHSRLLRDQYGVAPSKIARLGGGNLPLLYRLATQAAQADDRLFRQRHRVSAPPGMDHRGEGTHVHIVDSRYLYLHLLSLFRSHDQIEPLPPFLRVPEALNYKESVA